MRPKTSTILLVLVGSAFTLAILVMVVASLHRPEVATFAPSPIGAADVGDRTVGPLTYTVDATAHDRWTYFDFSRGSVVAIDSRRSLDWDIAFQRHRMITNSGDTNPLGQAGVIDLGPVPLDSALTVPAEGYSVDQRSGDASRSRVLEDWYDYSWTSHLLRPGDRAYAIRTADGRYVLLRFQGYYCPGGVPGCVTFRYRYRGDGGRAFPAVADPPFDPTVSGNDVSRARRDSPSGPARAAPGSLEGDS